MKNVLRIALLALPLVGGATLAMAQSNRDHSVVTGNENSTREVTGRPPIQDDGGNEP